MYSNLKLYCCSSALQMYAKRPLFHDVLCYTSNASTQIKGITELRVIRHKDLGPIRPCHDILRANESPTIWFFSVCCMLLSVQPVRATHSNPVRRTRAPTPASAAQCQYPSGPTPLSAFIIFFYVPASATPLA